ncbi:hypothetical protein BJH93_04035 [Kocuria polaris]|nr:hypothetical protein [Kocuria polaris]
MTPRSKGRTARRYRLINAQWTRTASSDPTAPVRLVKRPYPVEKPFRLIDYEKFSRWRGDRTRAFRTFEEAVAAFADLHRTADISEPCPVAEAGECRG